MDDDRNAWIADDRLSSILGLVQTERQYELIYRLIEYYVEQIQQHQPSHSAV